MSTGANTDWAILASLALLVIIGMRIWKELGLAFPRCWFVDTLHIPCPTCGSGRALLALGHFELLRALSFNPLIVLGIIGLFITAGTAASGRLHAAARYRDYFTPARVASIVALLVLANWIYLFFVM